ncbi:biotin transporter BioY [Amycolatopsis sacchari]|uniref:biotin transporter BioY n=1 Tax=Amycolatopsis sacchari TaxID=115433 RepID=UPI003D71DD34
MRTRDIVYVALFAAITAGLALFPPLPLSLTGVPITAQSLGPMLAGSILGWKRGALSQLLFLALVAAGLPLLAGGTGGLGRFASASGGYIIGWAIIAGLIGWLFERLWHHLNLAVAILIIAFGGIVVLYAIGSAWVAVVVHLGYFQAVATNGPFLIGDACKVVIAALIAMGVKRAYPVIEPRPRTRQDKASTAE